MITITIPEQVLPLLREVYANKLNATSRGARYAMNTKKRAFKEAVRVASTVEGAPVQGPNITAIYRFVLPRCDLDAPLKSVQDAIESIGIACRDDRVIRTASIFLFRPKKATKKRAGRSPGVTVYLFNTTTEKPMILSKTFHLLDESAEAWGD